MEYWNRWQVPVCAMIIFIPAVVAAVLAYRKKEIRPRAANLWCPCWRRFPAVWLLCFRGFFFISMACALSLMIRAHGLSSFYFYTQWTFSLVIFYFALGTVISAHGWWASFKRANHRREERTGCLENLMDLEGVRSANVLQETDFDEKCKKVGFWGCTLQVVYQTCAGAVMMTDVVFWCLIVPFMSNEHFTLNLLMGSMHSLNLFFLLLDTALNSMPFTWFGMSYFVLWSSIYVIFQWILHACGFQWWPYPFLKLDTPWAPLWYFCMALVHVPCYFFYYGVVRAKDRFFSKWFPGSYISLSS
ncbi:protein rolling protein isoform X2 [Wolffia australiana]